MPLLVALLALAVTPAARADTLTYDSSGFFAEVMYSDTGTPNTNRLALSEFEGKLLFQETHVSGSPEISSSGGCVTNAVTKTRATCPFPSSLEGQLIWILLSGNSDTLDTNDLSFGVLAIGAEGDDMLEGGEADDVLVGGVGDDSLHGKGGSDRLQDSSGAQAGGADQFFGDAGNDTLVGAENPDDAAGTDLYDGGTGVDRVVYDARQFPIAVDLAAGTTTTDRGSGVVEVDTLAAIEDVTGTPHADTIQGDGGGNALAGLAGNDVLKGGAGGDALDGGTGDDQLWPQGGADSATGGEGNDALRYDDSPTPVTFTLAAAASIESVHGSDHADTLTGSTAPESFHGRSGDDSLEGSDGPDQLYGDAGADQISGGAGNDVLEGGGEADQFDGGSGDDTIKAVDSVKETIGCGLGNDTVEADDLDTVLADCENVTRTAPGPGPGNPDPGTAPGGDGTAKAVLEVRGGRVKLDRKRRGKLRLTCSNAACAGTLLIKVKGKRVARIAYALQAGQTKRVAFRLNKRGRRLIKGKRKLAALAGKTKITLRR